MASTAFSISEGDANDSNMSAQLRLGLIITGLCIAHCHCECKLLVECHDQHKSSSPVNL